MQDFFQLVGYYFYYLTFALLVIVPLWRIFKRTGLDHRLALLVFIPYIGWLGALGVLAFVRWPANRLPDISSQVERR